MKSALAVARLRFAATAFSLCLGVLATTASHAQVPANIRIAVVPNYPPLEFKDTSSGAVSGFDVDLGEAIAKRMGAKLTWQETSFDQMVAALQTNRVDMILSGMTDLPSRREVVTFVDYMKSGPQFYVQKARATEFGSITALCGKRVGVNRRGSWPTEVAQWSDANCVKANKPAITVVGTDGSADARMQLRQNRVDAAVQGGETIAYVNGIDNNAYAAVAQPFNWQYNGIGISKNNPQMVKAVSEALNQIIADGTYQTILKKWNIEQFAISKALINSQE
ncbi:ABC transporter substrate-binding protein [Paraburkholderia sp. BR10882]|uniref:ABC transporter substrate-binding protein n=1 Tax=unclassified Paraburkholderia TaxID=2615204 RepID=UPI0034CD9586